MSPEAQQELFWEEVDQIQQRHGPFFPPAQKKYIRLTRVNDEFSLSFEDGHEFSSATIMEIEFAFKMVFGAG